MSSSLGDPEVAKWANVARCPPDYPKSSESRHLEYVLQREEEELVDFRIFGIFVSQGTPPPVASPPEILGDVLQGLVLGNAGLQHAEAIPTLMSLSHMSRMDLDYLLKYRRLEENPEKNSTSVKNFKTVLYTKKYIPCNNFREFSAIRNGS